MKCYYFTKKQKVFGDREMGKKYISPMGSDISVGPMGWLHNDVVVYSHEVIAIQCSINPSVALYIVYM